MRIEGEHVFTASRDIVWPLIRDPDVLGRALPGCEKLELIGDNEYEGTLHVHIGPIRGPFHGRIKLSNIQPHSYTLEVDGRGPAGFLRGAGAINLTANGGDTTTMTYDGDVEIGGRLTSLSQRMLDTSANAVIRQSLEGLDQHVAARTRVHTTAIPNTPVHEEAPAHAASHHRQTAVRLGLFLGVVVVLRWLENLWIRRLARKIARQLHTDVDK